MPAKTGASARPSIILSQTDADSLSTLALQFEEASPEAADLLLGEIERAEVRPDAEVPPDVVGMDSEVEFTDEGHGRSRVVRLVHPKDADIEAGRISVLTPIGAGLIGLSAGQSILWPDRNGQQRVLKIVRVVRAGG